MSAEPNLMRAFHKSWHKVFRVPEPLPLSSLQLMRIRRAKSEHEAAVERLKAENENLRNELRKAKS